MTIPFVYRLFEAESDAISRQAKGVIDGGKNPTALRP
jgi:hypothetical protein